MCLTELGSECLSLNSAAEAVYFTLDYFLHFLYILSQFEQNILV